MVFSVRAEVNHCTFDSPTSSDPYVFETEVCAGLLAENNITDGNNVSGWVYMGLSGSVISYNYFLYYSTCNIVFPPDAYAISNGYWTT